MAAEVEGTAEAQARRQESPAPCSGWKPAWGMGVRMMRACVTDRDTEDRGTDQETCSARHRWPGATAACLLQENRIFVSIPGDTCRGFGRREERCWRTHTSAVVGLLL